MPMNGRFFPIQTVWLGRTGAFATFNEPSLQFPGQLGAIVEDEGKCYRLVQHSGGTGAVATVAGGRSIWKTRASTLVTMDVTDGEAGGVNDCAGAYLGVITTLYYCYIQMGGSQSLLSDGSVAKGDLMTGGSTTDGEFDTIGGATELAVAVAYADDSGSPAYTAAYWILGALL